VRSALPTRMGMFDLQVHGVVVYSDLGVVVVECLEIGSKIPSQIRAPAPPEIMLQMKQFIAFLNVSEASEPSCKILSSQDFFEHVDEGIMVHLEAHDTQKV